MNALGDWIEQKYSQAYLASSRVGIRGTNERLEQRFDSLYRNRP